MSGTTRFETVARFLAHHVTVIAGAIVMTALCFFVLPLIQIITKPPTSDLLVQAIDTASLPPPPSIVEEEPEEEEEEPEEEPPKLEEDPQPLDLSQLELALNAGFGSGLPGGDFEINLGNAMEQDNTTEALFSMADLDQQPRVIYQPGPVLTARLRQRAPGRVNIIFIVNEKGRVEEPRVQSSTDPIFEKPALQAVSQWKFEPGKRNGQAVRFRMKVPITFPKGD